jgi:hypothetical protein
VFQAHSQVCAEFGLKRSIAACGNRNTNL